MPNLTLTRPFRSGRTRILGLLYREGIVYYSTTLVVLVSGMIVRIHTTYQMIVANSYHRPGDSRTQYGLASLSTQVGQCVKSPCPAFYSA